MTVGTTGRLIDYGFTDLMDTLVARPGLSFLRLHGSGVDMRVIHVGREQCFVVDHGRKVKDRIGERLVRWGHLKRETLVTMLSGSEDRNTVLDFTSQVPSSIVEYVAMTQALDSLDRLMLFPHLQFELGEQQSAYRGTKLTASALKKRVTWASQSKDSFLKWRSRIESGQLNFYPTARDRTPAHTAVECAILERTGWEGIQCRLHDPLFNIAEQLDVLEREGSLSYTEDESPKVPTVLRSRWVVLQHVGSSILLLGFVLSGLVDWESTWLRAKAPLEAYTANALAHRTIRMAAFEALRLREVTTCVVT